MAPLASRTRRLAGFLAAAALLLVLGSGIYFRIQDAAAEGEEDAAATTAFGAVSADSAVPAGALIPVEGEEVVRDTLILAVGAAAEAASWQQTILTSQVTGRLSALAVRENDLVEPGRALVEVDPSEFQMSVREAEAQVRQAQAQFEEMTLLNEEITNAETRAERERFARARSGLEQAQVALQRAEMNLARTRMGAPFAGRVANLKVVPGQWIQQGQELMTILDLDPIKVEVRVLEGEVGYLAAGRQAKVTFAAFPDETFTGRVQTINPVVETGTRTARVTVLVPNPQGRILPGMYARVSLDAQRFPNRLLVPRSAILERDRRTMLFVYNGEPSSGRAEWRYVTTGRANSTQVEILQSEETDSVRPGEIVLTNGHYTLIHDAKVRLVDNAQAAGGRPE